MGGVEPTYEYVKGLGWVPLNFRVMVEIFRGFKVTVTDKEPAEGDRYFAVKSNHKNPIAEAMSSVVWQLDNGFPNVGGEYMQNAAERYKASGYKLFTVKCERI